MDRDPDVGLIEEEIADKINDIEEKTDKRIGELQIEQVYFLRFRPCFSKHTILQIENNKRSWFTVYYLHKLSLDDINCEIPNYLSLSLINTSLRICKTVRFSNRSTRRSGSVTVMI
jgi:hypothetical protein